MITSGTSLFTSREKFTEQPSATFQNISQPLCKCTQCGSSTVCHHSWRSIIQKGQRFASRCHCGLWKQELQWAALSCFWTTNKRPLEVLVSGNSWDSTLSRRYFCTLYLITRELQFEDYVPGQCLKLQTAGLRIYLSLCVVLLHLQVMSQRYSSIFRLWQPHGSPVRTAVRTPGRFALFPPPLSSLGSALQGGLLCATAC